MKRFVFCFASLLLLAATVFGEDEDEPLVKSPPFSHWAGLARAAYKSGDNQRAIKLYTEALKFRSSVEARRRALIRRGNAYVNYNEPDKGIIDFNQALRLGACEACICIDRALAYDCKGDVDEALRQFARAIELEPDNAIPYSGRGNIYFNEDNYKEALTNFSKAIEFAPNDWDERIGRAHVYYRLRQDPEALADLDIALQHEPTSAVGYLMRARVYSTTDALKARTNLDRALQYVDQLKGRNRPYALEFVANFLATCPIDSLRNGKAAVKFALEACELNGWKDGYFVSTLAAAYAEAGDFDNAVKYGQRALRIMPPHKKSLEKQKMKLALYENHKPYRDVIK